MKNYLNVVVIKQLNCSMLISWAGMAQWYHSRLMSERYQDQIPSHLCSDFKVHMGDRHR